MNNLIKSIVFLPFTSVAFAADLPQVYQCYDELARSGVMASAGFDELRNAHYNREPYYISQNSVTDKGFLVFRGRIIYRCDFPKQDILSATFKPCHKDVENSRSYRLDLKLGFGKHALTVEVPKKNAKKIHISSEINYRSQMGSDSYCEVSCKEELGEANVNTIEAELAGPVSKAYAAWTDFRDARRKEDANYCGSGFNSAIRFIQNKLSDTTTTEGDCLKGRREKSDRVVEAKRKEIISSLKSCGGTVYDSATVEIAKLEGKAVIPAVPAKLEADSAGDKSADEGALGKR